MDEIFCLQTQLCNHIQGTCEFEVEYYCPLPSLPPGKTRVANLSQIMRCCRELRASDWPIRVLIDQQFTGLQFMACDLFSSVRIMIEYENSIPRSGESLQLCVINAVPEKRIDFLLRLKIIGPLFGRDMFWSRRRCVRIGQETRMLLPLPIRDNPLPLLAAARGGAAKKEISSQSENASPVRKDNGEKRDAVMGDRMKKIRPPLMEKKKKPKIELISNNESESEEQIIPVLEDADLSTTTEKSSSIEDMEPARNGQVHFRGPREQMTMMEDDQRPQMDSFVNLLLFVFAISIVGLAKALLK